MLNKFKSLSLIVVMLVSVYGMAQKGTKSPYSVYGIGELKSGQYAYFNGLGGAQIGNTDSTIVTLSNPASYSYIARNRPIFQVGLNGQFSKLSTSNNSANIKNFGLDQFQLGLPIKKNWGASIGLSPYSATGYLISNPIIEGTDTLAMTINEGKGTISNFHIGTAFKQKLWHNAKLSLGVNANFLFGDIEKIQSYEYTTFPGGAFHSRVKNTTYLSDLQFDFGFLIEQNLYRNSFTIGGTFTPGNKMNSTQDALSFAYSRSFYQNYTYLFNIDVNDTAHFSEGVTGITFIPQAIKLGGEYRVKPCPGSDQSYLLIFKADFNHQKWSDYYTEYNGIRTDSLYADRTSIAFGIEYSPYANASVNNNLIPYLGKLHYRIGGNYTLSEILIENSQLSKYGISFGLGIPILNGNSNTNLNLGVTYAAFGTTENKLIKEQNLGVSFGISISPGIYDRWFLKKKYD